MKCAIVFPGQGSQRPGMGEDFYKEYPVAKQVYQAASEASGLDLEEICFREDERLNLTECTQPAILTTEIAMLRVAEEELGLTPEYFAGHSLGEYTALVASGALELGDAVQIVRKRGALMQRAVPEGEGAMAACILPSLIDCDFREIVTDSGAEIANYNSKDQVVISGKKEFVEKATGALQEKFPDIQIVFLTVSAPFHSSLMKSIEPEFRGFLESFPLKREKSSNVLSNYTGNFHVPENLTENLTKQISGSVDWIANMRVLISKNVPILEIGPNRPLGKFFQTLGKEVPSITTTKSMKKINLEKHYEQNI